MTIKHSSRFLARLGLATLLLAHALPALADGGGRGRGGHAGKGRGSGQAHPQGQRPAPGPAPGRRDPGDRLNEGAGKPVHRAGAQTRLSLARTHILLRVARATIQQGGAGRARFREAALNQRAAGIALRRSMPRVALHLTRTARAIAREILAKNRAAAPPEAADRAGEFDGARADDAERFIEQARKQRGDRTIGRSLGKSGALLRVAVRSSRRGGKGAGPARKAAVYQRAARAASQKGRWKTALHLTARSRKSAREALAANGEAAPAGSADETGEFAGASTDGAEVYVEAAEASVPAEVDEQAVEAAEGEASSGVDGAPDLDAAAEVDFEAYEYDLEASESGATTTEDSDGPAGEE